MAAGRLDIRIEQGATFTMTLTIKDSLGVEVDLTGETFAGQIRRTAQNRDVLADFDFDILDQTSATGKVQVSLTPEKTAAIPVGPQNTPRRISISYAYDIERTLVDGSKIRLLQGVAIISPEVTR